MRKTQRKIISVSYLYVVFNKREVVFYQSTKVILYSDKTRASSLLNIFKNNTYNTIG